MSADALCDRLVVHSSLPPLVDSLLARRHAFVPLALLEVDGRLVVEVDRIRVELKGFVVSCERRLKVSRSVRSVSCAGHQLQVPFLDRVTVLACGYAPRAFASSALALLASSDDISAAAR